MPPDETDPCPPGSCEAPRCEDDEGIGANAYIVGGRLIEPGETLTWTTHEAGGGATADRATKITSSSPNPGGFRPDAWSSFTCPGDSLCAIARMQGAFYHLEGFEAQIMDTQRYCYNTRDENDVSDIACTRDSFCNHHPDLNFDWDCQDERPPKWHFFFGPRNSTYILSNAEFRVAERYAWSDVLGNQALQTYTDISGYGKRIPFSSFQLPWVNCASLIMRPDWCGPRVAGSPASGNYWGMERDLFRVEEEPTFWCEGERDICRFDNREGYLWLEKKNPLAGGSWWKEAVIQIPLKYMSPGTNTIRIRVAGDPDYSYRRLQKCDKGTFVYNNDPSAVDKRLAQASCSSLNFESQEGAEIPELYIDRANRISGSFSPAMEIFPLNPDSISINTSDWTAHGTPTPPVIDERVCDDDSCGIMQGDKYLRLTPQDSGFSQYIRSKYVELGTQPSDQYSLNFTTRNGGDTSPIALTTPALERQPNLYREPLNIYTDAVNGGRYISSGGLSWPGYYYDYVTGNASNLTSVDNQWTNRQVVFSPTSVSPYSGDDDWIRDHTESSTKVRFTLPLLGFLKNQAIDYANVHLTSNPTPESVSMHIKRLPEPLPTGISETLKDSSGNWVEHADIRNHFDAAGGWIKIGGWNDGSTAGWSAQTPIGSLHEATWTVPSDLTPGKYLLMPNINYGYDPDDGETQLTCSGNPYTNFVNTPGRIKYADCSESCGKVIELVQCPDATPSPPVVSMWNDGSMTELSINSDSPTQSSTSGISYADNILTLDFRADVPAASDLGETTQVEALLYKRGTSISLPSGDVDPANFPNAVYLGPVTELTNDGYSRLFRRLGTNLQEAQGPWITISVRTVETTCDPLRSAWVTYHVDLRTSIEGVVMQNTSPDGICSDSPSILDPNEVLNSITLTYKQFFGSTITETFSYEISRFSNSFTLWHYDGPYTHPWFWINETNLTSLRLTPAAIADNEEGYACALNNPDDGTGRCVFPTPLHAPRWVNNDQKFRFCLVRGILMHDSWWQTRGGLAFSDGNATLKPPIKPAEGLTPPARSSKCDPDVCQPFVVARRLGVDPVAATQTINAHTSSGFLISNSNLNPNSPYSGFLSQSQLGGGAFAKNAGISTQPTQTENYEDFKNKFVEAQMTTLSAPTSEQVIQAIHGNQYGTDASGSSMGVVYISRSSLPLNLTANPGGGESAAGIHIPANRKVIVFVDGSLTITGAENLANQITVDPTSFFLIVANGNITFSSQLGYGGDTGYTQMDPVVNGIFYADGEIIIQSNSDTDPNDRKFVGAGSFIGRQGVQLNRKFDSSNLLDREKNAASPVEMFIHRPDLVINTPNILKTTTTTWQEVN